MTDADYQFIAVFPQMYSDLYRYLAYRIPNLADAEDVIAKTALLAWEKRHQHELSRGTIQEWMIGIAKNQVRMYWRSHTPQCALEEIERLFADASPSFEYAVSDHLDLERMFAALTNEQKALLALHYLDGMSYNDIANVYQGTPAQFRQKVSRTLSFLRNQFTSLVE